MGMESKTVKVGIVGAGFGQAVHLPALRMDPRYEVRAICDRVQERARKTAKEKNIQRWFDDPLAMMRDGDIDAVTIAAPPGAQPEIALAALEEGKPVFCEKPLALTLSDADLMCKTAGKVGLANMVDFEFSIFPAFKEMKRILSDGAIGRLRHLHLNWHVETNANRVEQSSWKTDREAGGGALRLFVSHSFHYLEWISGPVRKLNCLLYKKPGDRRDGDTLVQVNLEFASGAAGTAVVSTDSPFGSGHRLEIYGEEGALFLDDSHRAFGFELVLQRRGRELYEKKIVGSAGEQSEEDDRIQAVAGILRRFADWITTGKPEKPDFSDGLRVQRLIEAASASHASGAWVEV